MSLNLEPTYELVPDRIYARLLALGQGRSDNEARRALSALAFVLINQIGDEAVIDEAFALVERLPTLSPEQPAQI